MPETVPAKRSADENEGTAPGPKRGRGRPPKEVSEVLHASDTSAPKRPRGRPRKNSSELLHPRKDPDAPKRPRGRPRKDANSAVSPTKQETPVAKRGRPRKDAGPTTPSTGSSKVATGSKKSGDKKAPMLEDIVGTYEISCEEIEGNWPDRSEDMALSISPLGHQSGILIASFDLGILEGTMLLATTKTQLGQACAQMKKTDKPVFKVVSKPALIDRTVYFAWRGQEVGDTDEIHYDSGSYQRGEIKFKDATLASFVGSGGFPALGDKCEFVGTKIDDEPEGEPEPWSTFSEEAYEEANRRRWG